MKESNAREQNTLQMKQLDLNCKKEVTIIWDNKFLLLLKISVFCSQLSKIKRLIVLINKEKYQTEDDLNYFPVFGLEYLLQNFY